jgi:hypothetical protein
MARKILLLAVCILSATFSYGQCKYKTKGGLVKLYEKNTSLDIEAITMPKMLFDKYFVAAGNTFIKTVSGEYYYMVPFTRSYSAKFEIDETTPLVFFLDNGEQLKLFPPQNVEGKSIVTKFTIYLYYKISKEQVEILATKNIEYLRIYVLSEKEMENTFQDELGTYFEFQIMSDKYKDNVFDGANCILQY